MKLPLSFAVLSLFASAVCFAQAAPPKKAGIEATGYKWNAQEGEKLVALKLKGDAKAGQDAFEVCSACHLPSGAGRPDGTFPQLAHGGGL